MKKILVIIVTLAMLAAMLVGCQTATPAPTQAPATQAPTVAPTEAPTTAPAAPTTQKENVTISYITSQGWLTDAEQTLGKKFAEQTGITVDYQVIPADQYFNVAQTKLNSGECPDIFCSQSGAFDIVSQWNVEKNCADLSGEDWVSRMDPLAAQQVTANGKLYGQCVYDDAACWAICYNKSIFTKLNLQIPKTYADFKADCVAILASGVTPIYEPVSDGWHHVLWFPEMGPRYEQAEPGLADKLNGNTAKFADSQTMLTALTQLKEIADSGYFGKNYMSDAQADAPTKLASGKYAMSVQNESFPQSIVAADPTQKLDNWGFFVIPLADNQILNVNPAGPSRFIYSGSKYVAEAKKYFSFIAQQENLQYILDNDNNSSNLCWTGLKDKYTPDVKDFYSRYTQKGTVYQTAIKYVNPQWMDMGKYLSAMFSGQSTPLQVLQAIDTNRAQQAAAAKDPAWK